MRLIIQGNMSYEDLERYSNKVLLSIARGLDDQEKLDVIRKILASRYSEYPYQYIYLMYVKSVGIQNLALGDAIASHLASGNKPIEVDVLRNLLPTLKNEELEKLRIFGNEFVSSEADTIIEERTKKTGNKSKAKIIRFEKRDEKND